MEGGSAVNAPQLSTDLERTQTNSPFLSQPYSTTQDYFLPKQ